MRRLAIALLFVCLAVALAVPVHATIRSIPHIGIPTVVSLAGGSSTQPLPDGGAPGQPSGRKGASERRSKWDARDTAVYVVSTLNLLHTSQGQPLSRALLRQGITNYDVYADDSNQDLYFVELVRDDGSVAGAVAYRMGWLKPVSISTLTDGLGVQKAQEDTAHAYHADNKHLLRSFTSTLPL